jgi:hypothetical protein
MRCVDEISTDSRYCDDNGLWNGVWTVERSGRCGHHGIEI